MAVLKWVSTFVLALIATMAVNYALFRQKRVGWLVALAFTLYFVAAVFDLKPGLFPEIVPPVLFFVGSIAMLWAVVSMVLERPANGGQQRPAVAAPDPKRPSQADTRPPV
jgi:hypothetical protein